MCRCEYIWQQKTARGFCVTRRVSECQRPEGGGTRDQGVSWPINVKNRVNATSVTPNNPRPVLTLILPCENEVGKSPDAQLFPVSRSTFSHVKRTKMQYFNQKSSQISRAYYPKPTQREEPPAPTPCLVLLADAFWPPHCPRSAPLLTTQRRRASSVVRGWMTRARVGCVSVCVCVCMCVCMWCRDVICTRTSIVLCILTLYLAVCGRGGSGLLGRRTYAVTTVLLTSDNSKTCTSEYSKWLPPVAFSEL